ncbi:Uncharacterized protein AArcCO_0155 [Halalkaliarchaeum sp. AArc-CO]|uniref:hypothetical protein n=1 Tax=unclassified Halalkaliarchaeum TaxID=2678344 RepID=UPI00217DBE14|nr:MULTISPECIES: hypothetical protein [unclassified Halalkaliarchaeum]MDR5674571.1 hypothetical protein [Halalkaliarchaeum sp. AArc-GB]UWG49486.1 Uncharacterized protein AArcCO_0155 [Halalkaliarchaeum sp. AArc-CO]
MSRRNNRIPVECGCTRCMYNQSRTCNFQGRLQINGNGECASKDERPGGGGPGPFGDD